MVDTGFPVFGDQLLQQRAEMAHESSIFSLEGDMLLWGCLCPEVNLEDPTYS